MYSKKDFEIIKNIIHKNLSNIVAVYLFGSYARGTANNNSDIDIAILIDKNLDWEERHKALNYLYRESANKGLLVDFIIKNINDYEEEKVLPTISRVIDREGRLL